GRSSVVVSSSLVPTLATGSLCVCDTGPAVDWRWSAATSSAGSAIVGNSESRFDLGEGSWPAGVSAVSVRAATIAPVSVGIARFGGLNATGGVRSDPGAGDPITGWVVSESGAFEGGGGCEIRGGAYWSAGASGSGFFSMFDFARSRPLVASASP